MPAGPSKAIRDNRRPARAVAALVGAIALVAILMFANSWWSQIRRHEVVGRWDWRDQVAHFDPNGEWGAYLRTSPTRVEDMGGYWTISGKPLSWARRSG